MLSVDRKVSVTGAEENAGFYSAIRLVTDPKTSWADADYLAPGLLYGEPHTRASAPGGSLYYNARHFIDPRRLSVRAALRPLFSRRALGGGHGPCASRRYHRRPRQRRNRQRRSSTSTFSLALWARAKSLKVESSSAFGCPGQRTNSRAGLVLVRARPTPRHNTGTTSLQSGEGRVLAELQGWVPLWRQRVPAWRGARCMALGMAVSQSAHHAPGPGRSPPRVDRSSGGPRAGRDDRAGIPFVIDSVSGKPGSFRPALLLAQNPRFFNASPPSAETEEVVKFAQSLGINIDPKAAELDLWPKITMGFCGENIEAAGQILTEADRDPSPRGQRLRKLGLMIIDSFIRLVPMDSRARCRRIRYSHRQAQRRTWRARRCSARVRRRHANMVDVYRRESAHGREHPEWLAWAKAYSDWLLTSAARRRIVSRRTFRAEPET